MAALAGTAAACDTAPRTKVKHPSIEFDNNTLANGHAAIHSPGQFEIVGGDDGRQSRSTDKLRERIEHMVGRMRIEIAGRLVGQQDTRRIGDRTGNRHTLLLTARQFRRPMIQPRLEAEISQQFGRTLACFANADSPRIICGIITFSSAENSGSR